MGGETNGQLECPVGFIAVTEIVGLICACINSELYSHPPFTFCQATIHQNNLYFQSFKIEHPANKTNLNDFLHGKTQHL